MVRVSGLVLFSLVLVWFGLFFVLVWSGGLVFGCFVLVLVLVLVLFWLLVFIF